MKKMTVKELNQKIKETKKRILIYTEMNDPEYDEVIRMLKFKISLLSDWRASILSEGK